MKTLTRISQKVSGLPLLSSMKCTCRRCVAYHEALGISIKKPVMKEPLTPQEQAIILIFVLGLICGMVLTFVMMAGFIVIT